MVIRKSKTENYTLTNDIMEAFCKFRIPGEARQVLDFIIRKTCGENRSEGIITLSQFTSGTNLKTRSIRRSLKLLQQMNLIQIRKNELNLIVFSLQRDYEKWSKIEVKGCAEMRTRVRNIAHPENVKKGCAEMRTRVRNIAHPENEGYLFINKKFYYYNTDKKDRVRNIAHPENLTEVNSEVLPINNEENTSLKYIVDIPIQDEQDSVKKNKSEDVPIQLHHFDLFWKIYPRKVDKGKAFSSWKKICQKKPKERPTWWEVKYAILKQRKTERWQDKKFIPHPTTWLNQSRWLDDPNEMKSITFTQNGQKPFIIEDGRRYDLCPDGRYRNVHGEIYIP